MTNTKENSTNLRYENCIRSINARISLVLAIRCLADRFDGVRIDDSEFCRIFGVKTIKSARKKWFIDEAKRYFSMHVRSSFNCCDYFLISERTPVRRNHPNPIEDLDRILICNKSIFDSYDEEHVSIQVATLQFLRAS